MKSKMIQNHKMNRAKELIKKILKQTPWGKPKTKDPKTENYVKENMPEKKMNEVNPKSEDVKANSVDRAALKKKINKVNPKSEDYVKANIVEGQPEEERRLREGEIRRTCHAEEGSIVEPDVVEAWQVHGQPAERR